MSSIQKEDINLEQIKSQMTPTQLQEMSQLISNELRRRKSNTGKKVMNEKSGVKSSGLSSGLAAEDVGDLYAGLEERVKQLRLQKMQKKEKSGRAKKSFNLNFLKGFKKSGRSSRAREGNFVLACGVISIGVLKVIMSMSLTSATTESHLVPELEDQVKVNTPLQANLINNNKMPINEISTTEKEILTQLDLRRVELEKRRESLDRREEELKQQDITLTERLTELRSLTNKLSAIRQEHDHRYEARMDQLANVYGSMDPNEAAPLIARLDDEIALALLQRMPGKRMGQILSLMEKDRAVALTKKLTNKTQIES